ncbi:PH domain-containing protein [Brachybacterium muris]|uniref:PH domain-containing protein n=1 Tax=Brachybacterium muris TaxID=219301 RepID=UPI00223AE067|nr:PH domain-containing protein [Brachybacterium muris]MCT2294535.1 PH domain-containing protein [Brachybacterium muris]
MHPAGTVVFRPRMVRVVGYGIAAVMLVGLVAGGILIPGFSPLDRAGMIMFGVLAALFCHLQASVRLVAGPETLEVRNLLRSRTITWPEVVGVSFPMGDPWAHLDLADGTTLATWAIQRADGKRGIADAHRLAALVRERGEAADNDA